MTANKRQLAGAAAAIAFFGAVVVLSQHRGGPALTGGASGSGAAAGSAAASSQPGKPVADAHRLGDQPQWQALTPAQQLVLQPLHGEWNQMDTVRKQKWLQLANRFGALRPEEQQRLQERMRLWSRLTPAQRDLARETYTRTRKITPDQKTATWENYQQLTQEQKKELAASNAARKAPTVVATQAGGKAVTPLGQGATSCPPGLVKNSVSATPPCVAAPAPVPGSPVPATPNPAVPNPAPGTPQNPPQQEKPVPSTWGITPNNA
jgi:hypothetical protein